MKTPSQKIKRFGGLLLRTKSISLACQFYGLGLQGRALGKSVNYPVSFDRILGLKNGTLREKILELAEDRAFLDYMNTQVLRAGEDLVRRGLKGTVGVFNYGPLLYAIVRILQPLVMVETGVASGTSSACILKAMEINGKGKLISIDLPMGDMLDSQYTDFQFKRKGAYGPTLVPPDFLTGYAVPEKLKHRWQLILGDAKVELPEALTETESVDIFMHDSEHSYEHMTFEFETVYPKLRQGGVILSDDVSWNDSFKDFAMKVKRPFHLEPIGILVK